jgi:hypothetical protein
MIDERDLPGIRSPLIRSFVLRDHSDADTDARVRLDDRIDSGSVVLLGSEGTEVYIKLGERREITRIEIGEP